MPVLLMSSAGVRLRPRTRAIGAGAGPIVREAAIIVREHGAQRRLGREEEGFVIDPEQKVGAVLAKAGAKVTSFVRLEVGEGIEKKEVDFAAEVAATQAAAAGK